MTTSRDRRSFFCASPWLLRGAIAVALCTVTFAAAYGGECNPSTVCRASTGDCDLEAVCTSMGLCPPNGLKPATTACGPDPTGECGTKGSCTGSSQVCPGISFKSATTPCGPDPTGECGTKGSCTGSSQVCPGISFKSATTPCGPDPFGE